MASKAIKGITIEIGGNTTKLNEALKDVNKTSTNLKTELREVEKGLKLDPKNTELLHQKQELLKESVKNTAKELEVLEEAQKQVNEQFKRGEVGEEQLRAIQREVINTKSKLQGLKKDVVTPFDKMESAVKSVGHASKATAKAMLKIGGAASKVGGVTLKAFKGVGTAIAGAGTAAAGGALAVVESTAELRSDLSKLEQNAKTSGKSMEGLEGSLKTLSAITGETDSSVEGLSNLLQIPMSDNQMQQAIEGLTGAVISFPDTLKFESLSDSLQETVATGKGVGQFGELLERSGINLDEFNKDLERGQTQTAKLNTALQYLSRTGLANVSKEYKEANKDQLTYKESQLEMQMQLAELAEKVLPTVNEAMGLFNDVIGNAIEPIAELLDVFIDMVNGVEGSSDRFSTIVIDLLDKGVNAIIGSIPNFVRGLAQIIESLVGYLTEGDTITEWILGFVDMFTTIVEELLPKIPGIMWELGRAIVEGLWAGIKSLGGWLWDKIKDFGGGIIDGFKDVFGINSPSRVMKDEIGKYLAEGMAEGMTDYDFGSPEIEVVQNVTRNVNESLNSSNIQDLPSQGRGYGMHGGAFRDGVVILEADGVELARFVSRKQRGMGYNLSPNIK